jgi:hypothetical protein
MALREKADRIADGAGVMGRAGRGVVSGVVKFKLSNRHQSGVRAPGLWGELPCS